MFLSTSASTLGFENFNFEHFTLDTGWDLKFIILSTSAWTLVWDSEFLILSTSASTLGFENFNFEHFSLDIGWDLKRLMICF